MEFLSRDFYRKDINFSFLISRLQKKKKINSLSLIFADYIQKRLYIFY